MEEQKLGQDGKLKVGDGFIGMLNAFVDPAGLAKRVPAPLSWLWPVILLCIIYGVVTYLLLPYALALIDLRMSQQNVPVEQLERARTITHMVTQIGVLFTPLIWIGVLALLALLVGALGSIVGLRTKFMAACQLISALQVIATYIVIRARGDEITSQEQLAPPFGLDIFLQNIHGPLLALVNFFSIFEAWYLIVLTFGLAYLGKVSKGKAFFAIMPAWLLGLAYRVVAAMLPPG